MKPGSKGLSLCVTFLLGILALFAPNLATAKENPPNIVYIMADDLGYNELGCYGQTKIETPNIDRLAEEGIRFTQFYSGSAVCAPTRCNLMTGKHGGHAYIRNNSEVGSWDSFRGQKPLPEGTETLARMLAKAGYVCGAFGKWGLGEPGSSGGPLNSGFDRFFGYHCQRHAHNLYPRYLVDDREERPLAGNTRSATGATYAPEVIADEMLEWVRENKEHPFFLYYPTVIPHLALQAPDEEIAHYRGRWTETPYTGKSYQKHPTPKSCYAAMITFMDKQVGRLMDLLQELGLDENTIVLFTSDNGTTFVKEQVDYEFFGSVGKLRGLKGSLYEGGIRVPMVARWPGRIEAGTTTDHIAACYDSMATLADIAGIEPPRDTDGLSYLPTMTGKGEQREHEYLFWDFAGFGGQLAVRMGAWKGIRKDLKKNPKAPLELYRLDTDVGEKHDVVTDEPEITNTISKIMISARTQPEIEKFRFGEYSAPSE